MKKDKSGIPIYMTIDYQCFKNWLKEHNADKWSQLTSDDREILCRNQWRELYQYAGDYNIE